MRTKKRYQKKKKCNCSIPFFSKLFSRKKKGGSSSLLTNPPAFVGTPWGPTPAQWPEGHNANWYTLNPYNAPIRGGRKKSKKKSKKKKGGFFVTSDIQGLFRGVSYNLQNVGSTLTTNTPPVNPSPYMDQYKTIPMNNS